MACDVSLLLATLQLPFGLWPMVLACGCLNEALVNIAERHWKQNHSFLRVLLS